VTFKCKSGPGCNTIFKVEFIMIKDVEKDLIVRFGTAYCPVCGMVAHRTD
jgi:hypothetical protein